MSGGSDPVVFLNKSNAETCSVVNVYKRIPAVVTSVSDEGSGVTWGYWCRGSDASPGNLWEGGFSCRGEDVRHTSGEQAVLELLLDRIG